MLPTMENASATAMMTADFLVPVAARQRDHTARRRGAVARCIGRRVVVRVVGRAGRVSIRRGKAMTLTATPCARYAGAPNGLGGWSRSRPLRQAGHWP